MWLQRTETLLIKTSIHLLVQGWVFHPAFEASVWVHEVSKKTHNTQMCARLVTIQLRENGAIPCSGEAWEHVANLPFTVRVTVRFFDKFHCGMLSIMVQFPASSSATSLMTNEQSLTTYRAHFSAAGSPSFNLFHGIPEIKILKNISA